LTAAVRTQSPAERLIADEAALSWLCPVCGKVRAFEGGCPIAFGQQDECQKCGSPLFVPRARAPSIRVSSLAW
jgi:predicted RNA-binding Zn-ribbon protein involved in translation (DUF1610 family)